MEPRYRKGSTVTAPTSAPLGIRGVVPMKCRPGRLLPSRRKRFQPVRSARLRDPFSELPPPQVVSFGGVTYATGDCVALHASTDPNDDAEYFAVIRDIVDARSFFAQFRGQPTKMEPMLQVTWLIPKVDLYTPDGRPVVSRMTFEPSSFTLGEDEPVLQYMSSVSRPLGFKKPIRPVKRVEHLPEADDAAMLLATMADD